LAKLLVVVIAEVGRDNVHSELREEDGEEASAGTKFDHWSQRGAASSGRKR